MNAVSMSAKVQWSDEVCAHYAADDIMCAIRDVTVHTNQNLPVDLKPECLAFLTRRIIYRCAIMPDSAGVEHFCLLAEIDTDDATVVAETFALLGCPLHDQFGMSLITLVSGVGATLPWLLLALRRRLGGDRSDDLSDIETAIANLRNSGNDFRDQAMSVVLKNDSVDRAPEATTAHRDMLTTMSYQGIVSLGEHMYAPQPVRDGMLFAAFIVSLYTRLVSLAGDVLKKNP